MYHMLKLQEKMSLTPYFVSGVDIVTTECDSTPSQSVFKDSPESEAAPLHLMGYKTFSALTEQHDAVVVP